MANFVGYVLWSVWLVVFAAVLLVRGAPPAPSRRCGPMTAHARSGPAPCATGRSGPRVSSPSRSAGLGRSAVAGTVDDLGAALVGGAVTGLVIGAGQSSPPGAASRRPLGSRRRPPAWRVGLALGASVVGFRTSLPDLALMGMLTGIPLGIAQALALPPEHAGGGSGRSRHRCSGGSAGPSRRSSASTSRRSTRSSAPPGRSPSPRCPGSCSSRSFRVRRRRWPWADAPRGDIQCTAPRGRRPVVKGDRKGDLVCRRGEGC